MNASASPADDESAREARARRDVGDWPAAIAHYRRAIVRQPQNAVLFAELGGCCRQVNDVRGAIEAFEQAIALDPDHLAAYRGAADTALAQAARPGVPTKAAADFRKFAAAHLVALAQRQSRRGATVDAEATLREAVALDPKNPTAYAVLGEFLQARGRSSEGEKALRRAVALDPRLASAHIALGNALQSLGRHREMEAAYRRALEIDPTLRHVRDSIDWLPLLQLLYDSTATPAQILAKHREWGNRLIEETRKSHGAAAAAPFANKREPERRLRVAYLSPDFRYHAVSFFFEPLLAHHDRSVIDVYCYAEIEHPDFVTAALQERGGLWRRTFGLDDTALRAQLRADRIDIAIDLAGHTGHSRLDAFAIKPAPVTATWLGYPATTGLSTIDWRITDARADPPGQEQFHTEKLLRLPETFLCYRFYGSVEPGVTPPPALARGTITFGSFNNPLKVSPPALAAWARILAAVPGSRLVMKAQRFVDPAPRAAFIARFAAQGIAAERIELRAPQPGLLDHLTSYGEIDIALDPFPYNGTTTTCEALFMGVPMVSLIGDHHAARVGFDLLSQVGIAEFAAPDVEHYVATVVALAGDVARLSRLRQELRPRMGVSSLCDAPRFARAFEAGLRRMWREWCGETAAG
jgi:protein O-GlcNAc transferase